jgi:hypothetical protein
MIGSNWKYKELDFTNVSTMDNRFVMQDVQFDSGVRIATTDNSNAHWSRISKALGNGRLFTFNWAIYSEDRYKRGVTYKTLVNTFLIESDPSKNQFYDLEWVDDLGDPKTVKAAVFSEPTASNGLCDPITRVQRSLYSVTPNIYDPFVKEETGWTGLIGWVAYPYSLPDPWGGYSGAVRCVNNGNRPAPCKIEVTGNAENVRIYNMSTLGTNGITYFYELTGTTTSLVLDNTDTVLVDSDGLLTQTVTDNGMDASFKRQAGQTLLLQPWINDIVVLAEGNPEVKITFRDTYKLP